MKKRNTISLYDLFFKFPYKDFFKKQIIYALNPVKHIKETLLNNEEEKKK